MEKIPAASAMDWSIDLDKGLRSNHPGTRLQALEAVGPRLRRLGVSPNAPNAVAAAFGVLPGEARLFAETMLLRLAAEFQNGGDGVRARVIRSLVLEHRELARKGRAYDGVLARARVVEREEVLRRVKVVYDAGGARARALALRMFGCLADLAKDSVDVRHLVLSSLSSSCAMEVKAALFTAGCFCWLSEDFASIILEVLTRLISSPRLDANVTKAAIKALSKLHCTLAIILRAHKVGKKLLLGTLEDSLKAEMLFSLSKLSSKSTILFGDQVDFLLLFLRQESSLPMKTMALKCLCFMFRRNTCHFPVSRNVFAPLLQIIDDTDLPLCCKCDAFRILQKVCDKAPSVHLVGDLDLSKLVLAIESAVCSSSREMQDIALNTLVEVFCFLNRTRRQQPRTTSECSSFKFTEYGGVIKNMPSTSGATDHDILVNKIIGVIMNHIISLVNQAISKQNNEVALSSAELEKMYKTSLSIVLKLANSDPSAGVVALDKLRCLIKHLVRVDSNHYSEVAFTLVESFQTGAALEEHNIFKDIIEPVAINTKALPLEMDFRKSNSASPTEFNCKKKTSTVCDLVLFTLRVANACLSVLCKTATATYNIYGIVKVLIECMQQDASQYCCTYEYFCLLMHTCIAWNICKIKGKNQESDDSKVHSALFCTPSFWIVKELCSLRITKLLVRKRNYWEAYRSAMYCCHEGLWFTASFVFKKLADAFELSSFSFWFKSFLLFSASEIEMKLLLFPSATVKLIDELQTEGDLNKGLYNVDLDVGSILGRSADLHSNRAKVTEIFDRTCLANDTLASNVSSDCICSFQRWFISLRASFLEILIDVLAVLSACSSAQKDISQSEANRDHLTVVREHMSNQLLALANCSLRLSDLAKSYDLLAASYMDMDCQSFTCIARLAFMCSLLAFCTAFSVDFSKLPSCENAMPCMLAERFSHASILQDLHERTCGDGSHMISELQQFMSISFDETDFLRFSTRMNCDGYLERDSYLLFQFAVTTLLHVHEDVRGATGKEDTLYPLSRGMQFLSNILEKLMESPFKVPRYLFRVRPCLGAELFVFDSNPENRHDISISPGFQLSLNLCMQWKSVLERTSVRLTKLYCVLAASSTSCLDLAAAKGKPFEVGKTAEIVEMNTMLLQYIKNDLRKGRDKNVFRADMDLVTAFACFEPTDSGQGFSDCLLNVSSFPEGSYQIKWHAGCTDENSSYWSLLPLNDGAVFSIRKS